MQAALLLEGWPGMRTNMDTRHAEQHEHKLMHVYVHAHAPTPTHIPIAIDANTAHLAISTWLMHTVPLWRNCSPAAQLAILSGQCAEGT